MQVRTAAVSERWAWPATDPARVVHKGAHNVNRADAVRVAERVPREPVRTRTVKPVKASASGLVIRLPSSRQ